MKYGLLTYAENPFFFNIGDNIQSLAAKQFLLQVDCYINREKLAHYNGEVVKMIMNGWFTHNTRNWVPSENIKPLFVSFHLNNTAAPVMLNEKGIAYLKKHAPIGCRDMYTVNLLQSKGIEAYFTGCLTLTLDTYAVSDNERNDNVYIVDLLYNYPTWEKMSINYKSLLRNIKNGNIFKLRKKNKHLNNFISHEVLRDAVYINHELPSNIYTDEQKFAIADDLLKKYAKAKLVITSRIHCALPCLALGTPVIYVNGFDSFVDTCRFYGILDLFNRIDVDTKTGKFTANFELEGKITKEIQVKNLDKYKDLAVSLKEKCRLFIND